MKATQVIHSLGITKPLSTQYLSILVYFYPIHIILLDAQTIFLYGLRNL